MDGSPQHHCCYLPLALLLPTTYHQHCCYLPQASGTYHQRCCYLPQALLVPTTSNAVTNYSTAYKLWANAIIHYFTIALEFHRGDISGLWQLMVILCIPYLQCRHTSPVGFLVSRPEFCIRKKKNIFDQPTKRDVNATMIFHLVCA